jgi:hypothetical protein
LPQHRWEELVRGHGCRDESDAAVVADASLPEAAARCWKSCEFAAAFVEVEVYTFKRCERRRVNSCKGRPGQDTNSSSVEVADTEPSRVTQECCRHDRVRESGEKTSAASGSFGYDVYASARDIS